jgi:peptidoglycan/LPS O-acetylase OafA/YrhL
MIRCRFLEPIPARKINIKMKLEQLTFTRFLAAMAIVVFHYGENAFPFDTGIINFVFKQSYVGVSYFFLLSGFIMMIAYHHKDKIASIDYLKRRFARIYPVYLLSMVILIANSIVFGLHINYLGIFSLGLSLTQAWFPGHVLSFNAEAWTLGIEFLFYFCFPILFNRIYKKRSYKSVAVFIIMVFVASQLLTHVLNYSSFYKGDPSESHEFIYYFPIMHFNQFLMGNLAAMFFIRGVKTRNYDLLIVFLVLSTLMVLKAGLNVNFHNGLLAVLFAPLIILISANNGCFTSWFNRKAFVFLGEMSFSVYILQYPIYTLVRELYKCLNVHDANVIFYTGLLVLLVLSAIVYRFFELPMRSRINRFKF